ncbi:MAG: hypothetical protein ACFFCZ_07985 [Promethearchaeota archaeon]
MSKHRERLSKDLKKAIEEVSKPRIASCDQVVSALLDSLFPFQDSDELWVYPGNFIETLFKRLIPYWTNYWKTNRKSDPILPPHLLVVGPSGIGKTSTAYFMADLLNDTQIENKVCLSLKVDPKRWITSQDFTRLLASLETHPSGFLNLFFVDNLFDLFNGTLHVQWEGFIEGVTDILGFMPIFIGFIDVGQYNLLKRINPSSLKYFAEPPIFFSPFPLDMIYTLLDNKLNTLEKQVELLPIAKPARKKIASYSLGVPYLAFKLTAQCEEVAYNFDYKRISIDLVKEIAAYQGFELAHSLLIDNLPPNSPFLDPSLQKPVEDLKITSKRKHFLQDFLLFSLSETSYVTSSGFAEFFDKNLPSVLYHFKDLTKQQVLLSERSQQDARKVNYKLQKPLITALEILWMEEVKQDLLILSNRGD